MPGFSLHPRWRRFSEPSPHPIPNSRGRARAPIQRLLPRRLLLNSQGHLGRSGRAQRQNPQVQGHLQGERHRLQLHQGVLANRPDLQGRQPGAQPQLRVPDHCQDGSWMGIHGNWPSVHHQQSGSSSTPISASNSPKPGEFSCEFPLRWIMYLTHTF